MQDIHILTLPTGPAEKEKTPASWKNVMNKTHNLLKQRRCESKRAESDLPALWLWEEESWA